MARTTKPPAKKPSAKVAAAKRASAKKATAKKAARTPTRSTSRKASSKKASVKRTTPTKKARATKATAKKAAAKKAPTKKVAKKAPTKKVTAKAAVKKAPPKKAPAKTTVKKAPAKKTPTKSPYDKKFLDAQKEALLEERARLLKDVEALDAEAIELATLREPGDVQFDEESGEGDTLAVERERDLALSAQFRAQIEDIDRALEKIEKNTYGLCEVSGLPIPKERLRAIPWARERVEYKVGGFRR